jgi:hypothetical protein
MTTAEIAAATTTAVTAALAASFNTKNTTTCNLEHFVYNQHSVNAEWPRFLQKFKIFLQIIKLNVTTKEEDAVEALQHLLTVGGEKVFDIYFALENQETIKYAEFIKLLNERFLTTNVKIATYRFRECEMILNESLRDYATRLRFLGQAAGIKDKDVLDTEILEIICRKTKHAAVRDKGLEEAVKLEDLLTWKERFDLRNGCATDMQAKYDQNHGDSNLNAINSNRSYSNTTQTKSPNFNRNATQRSRQPQQCFNCGYEWPHKTKPCPALGELCSLCHKPNHFKKMCRQNDSSPLSYKQRSNDTKKTVTFSNTKPPTPIRAITHDENERFKNMSEDEIRSRFEQFCIQTDREKEFTKAKAQDPHNVCAIQDVTIRTLTNEEVIACPRTFLQIGNSKIKHLVDSGTNLNILCSNTYDSLVNRPMLQQTDTVAYAYHSKSQVPLRGEFSTTLTFKNKSVLTKYLVLNGNADDILGYSTAKALGIISVDLDLNPKVINTITNKLPANICSSHPIDNIVNTTGTMGGGKMDTIIEVPYPKEYKHPYESHPELFTGKIGKLEGYTVSFETDPNIKPCQQSSYPIPYALVPFTEAKLKKLTEEGTITKYDRQVHGKITWLTPMNPCEKLDDKGHIKDARITINAKQLNKAIIPQKRKIPSLTELQYSLNDSKVFSLLDFNEAFNQVCYNIETKPLTATSTPFGIIIWNCLNMGISCASELFQQAMEWLLGDIQGIKIALDDVLIHAKDKETAYKIQTEALDRIRKSGMTLNKNKCKFLQPQIVFFGMVISAEGIKPKQSVIEDLVKCKQPQATKDVSSFLGLAGYFKNRSPHQATIEKPLRRLLMKNTKFKWETEEANAYKILKESVITDALAHFDHRLRTELICDASPVGVSYFLTQIRPERVVTNGQAHIIDIRVLIRCGSHALSKAECNYSHLEKEAFACVWSMENCHIYTFGRLVYCITDSMGVQKIMEEDKIRKHTPVRFVRWKARLSIYNIVWVHRPGCNNIADFLSRNLSLDHKNTIDMPDRYENTINEIIDKQLPTAITMDELEDATNNDQGLQEIQKAIRTGSTHCLNKDLIQPFTRVLPQLSISSRNIVVRNDVIVVPQTLQQRIIDAAHEGHGGAQLCKRLLRNICWFEKMDEKIDKTIADCAPCQCNIDTTTTEPLLVSTIPPEKWHTVSLDFSSKNPSNDYTLVAKCENTREIVAKLTQNMTTEAAISVCKRIFSKYGIPQIIKSDNGPAFKSHEWKAFADKYHFFHSKITPLHPAANGGAERVMKMQNKAIRVANVENADWKDVFSKFLTRYRQTPNTMTGFSPNVAMSGSDKQDILPTVIKKNYPENLHDLIKENDAKAKERMRFYADANQKTKHRTFSYNNPILHKWDRPNKFTPLFDPSPYRVKEINGTRICAERSDHSITRNASKFKIITEKCHENAQKLLQQKANKIKTPKKFTTFTITNELTTRNLPPLPPPINLEILQAHLNTATPPPTPATFLIQPQAIEMESPTTTNRNERQNDVITDLVMESEPNIQELENDETTNIQHENMVEQPTTSTNATSKTHLKWKPNVPKKSPKKPTTRNQAAKQQTGALDTKDKTELDQISNLQLKDVSSIVTRSKK